MVFSSSKLLKEFHLDPKKERQILIVTEKLLTGFDATRDHTLLQAIARVSRGAGNCNGRLRIEC